MYARQKIVRDFIEAHPLCSIATVSEIGVAELGFVYVHISTSLKCYFVTKNSTRKHRNLEQGSKVTLGFVDEQEMIFVEIIGTAKRVIDSEAIAKIVSSLEHNIASRALSYWLPPVNQIEGDSFVYYEVQSKMIEYRNYANLEDGLDAKAQTFKLQI